MPDGWPEKFQDIEYVAVDPPLTEKAAAWWNVLFDTAETGLFPEALIDAIARDAPGAITGRIVSLDHVAETFKVEVTGLAPGRKEIFYKAKTFELTDGTARDGLTRVGPDWQGQGIGTGLMINLIDLGIAIGMDRIVVDAQDIGRYA